MRAGLPSKQRRTRCEVARLPLGPSRVRLSGSPRARQGSSPALSGSDRAHARLTPLTRPAGEPGPGNYVMAREVHGPSHIGMLIQHLGKEGRS
jgi:hypothetical protein